MPKKEYDLKKRIFQFIIETLNYLRKLPSNSINRIIVNQCGRSVTSIGANHEEADVAHTLRDFIYKMEIVRKEAKETHYWLRISYTTNQIIAPEECQKLLAEAEELVKILSAIINKSRLKK